MLDGDHLCLREGRVKPGEPWMGDANGLHFLFPTEGGGTFLVGNASQPLLPGDILIFQAPAPVRVLADPRGQLSFSWFSTLTEHLLPLLAADESCLVTQVLEGSKAGRRYLATWPVARECHKLMRMVPPQFNLEHRSHLVHIAGAILSNEFQNWKLQRRSAIPGEDVVMRTFENLSMGEFLDLRVGELAKKFKCGQRHLNRLFHRHFGISLTALRMEMRLLKAACLLRDPNAKVLNVAKDCGFNQLGLFHTCFKRRFGTSPGRWRQTKLAAAPESSLSADQECRLFRLGLCPWLANGMGKAESASGESQPK